MIPVATPVIGDVRIRRHVLDVEASRLAHLARRLGIRLRRTLVELPEQRMALQAVRDDDGRAVVTPMQDADGKPILEACLPSPEWLEHFRWYQNAVLKLLAEQRMRAVIKGEGKPPLSDVELEAEMEALARVAVEEMPLEQLDALLKARGVNISDLGVPESPATEPVSPMPFDFEDK